MIFIIGSDIKYKERALFSVGRLEKLGYKYELYDFGELGRGISVPELFGCKDKLENRFDMARLKPRILLHALEAHDEMVVWLDADAFVVERIDEVDSKDYDIGLTYRYRKTNGYVNTGVMFLYPTKRSKLFIQKWNDALPALEKLSKKEKDRSPEQLYLNDMIFEETGRRTLFKNKIKTIFDTKVKFFDLHVYNAYKPFSNRSYTDPKGAKIIHCLGGKEISHKNAIKRLGLE